MTVSSFPCDDYPNGPLSIQLPPNRCSQTLYTVRGRCAIYRVGLLA